ncbi:MAG TPA: ABC transporter permease [Dongiaceae bacterium]|nr:ABC transporter permease [Dongiaceae bacterium]
MKFAIRQLAKNPGFTVVALLTLAMGIGVNTTAFTFLNRLLLQSLPYRDPGRLVQVWASNSHESFAAQAPGDFFDEQEQNTVFSGMAAYVQGESASFAEPGQPAVRVGSVSVTANYFAVLGVQAQIGRLPSAEEEARSEAVALLSNAFWREHFAADPAVIGRTVKLDGKLRTIVGVMPPAVDDQMLFNVRPCLFPLDRIRTNREYRDFGWYTVVARLKPGVTVQQAQSEMTVLAARFAKDHPKSNGNRTIRVVAFPTTTLGDTATELTWTTMALSGLVLMIACVNLANLQLVRTTRRGQEIGIRIALGCSRGQLIWMLLLESLVLSVAGGALGILVARWSSAYIARYFSIAMPIDLRVIAFTFGVSVLTGALFGTVPAWLASRTDVNASLKSSGRGSTSDRSRHWLRQGLVVVQLAMALTLLAGAGFFVRGIQRLTHRNLGWDTTHEVIGVIELDHDTYGEQRDPRSLAFSERMQASLAALPGVEAAALSFDTPLNGFRTAAYRVEGQPAPEAGKELYAGYTPVSPGYLKVYGLHLVQGREFRDSDRPGSPAVVIVNEAMARKWWPGEDPIGKRIGTGNEAGPAQGSAKFGWAEVVGVVRDFEGAAEFYNPSGNNLKFMVPWAQNNHRFITFSIRTSGPSAAYKEPVRKAISLLAPDLAVSVLATVEEGMAGELSYFDFLRKVLTQIAGLGLLLSGVGIYGVVANLASERTKEIGIRMALGAQPGGIVWLFLRNGIQLAVLGAAIGLAAAFSLTMILGRIIPVLPGRDPWVVVGAALFLVSVSLFACWLPARRTSSVSPTTALRSE